MRFQPAWVLEALEPAHVESVFLPLAPRPETLTWFKRLGIKLFVNHPIESQSMLLRAILENPGETFSDAQKKALPKKPETILKGADHVFKRWESVLFNRSECDFLAAWREVVNRIDEPRQRELLAAAVRNVIGYWLSVSAVEFTPRFTPDELLNYFLGRQADQIFKGSEPAFALNLPFEELGDEVESSLYLLPLPILERELSAHVTPEKPLNSQTGSAPGLPGMPRPRADEVFHAWWKEKSDLIAAGNEFRAALKGWTFSWNAPTDWSGMAAKAGKTNMVTCCWSGEEASPRLHEETIAGPLKAAFVNRFPKADLFMKTAERRREDYDFLLTLR
ncbi:MAG: hypothetical protein HQM09_22295 [Candidatus Riflebacteria bacterium]|nr:hypothetical protein [Candidatus Riflebacteria bacterium]